MVGDGRERAASPNFVIDPAMACHNRMAMKLLRMKPGHGEIVLAEGDIEIAEQERVLIEAFRRELDAGMWAAVPTQTSAGRREAEMVRSFAEVPRDAERVIFFPRAAGGAPEGAPWVQRPFAGARTGTPIRAAL
jgi:hypothetical protein